MLKKIVNALAFVTVISSAHAAAPVEMVLGDWDLGREAAALRIRETAEEGKIEVLYCNRKRLIETGKCPTDLAIEMDYLEAEGVFYHDSLAQKGTQAWIFVPETEGARILYRFYNSWGKGELLGSRIR